jgi:hypothetical protein
MIRQLANSSGIKGLLSDNFEIYVTPVADGPSEDKKMPDQVIVRNPPNTIEQYPYCIKGTSCGQEDQATLAG